MIAMDYIAHYIEKLISSSTHSTKHDYPYYESSRQYQRVNQEMLSPTSPMSLRILVTDAGQTLLVLVD